MLLKKTESVWERNGTFKNGAEIAGQHALVSSTDRRLLNLMRRSHGVPIFICAPHKTGRTSLALEYARNQYLLDEVLWVNAASPAFVEAINKQTMLEHIHRQIQKGLSKYNLIIIDNLPQLNDRVALHFSSWIDQMIEANTSIIVITTPQEDSLGNYQSDRLLIDGEQLVFSQKWNKARAAACMRAFFVSDAPNNLRVLAALMMLMGHGTIDNLTELGYQIPFNNHSMLKSYCPLIEIDETTGYFNAAGIPLKELAPQIVDLLIQLPREGLDLEMSELEWRFECLTQMSVYLYERSEQAQSQALLELAGSLLTMDDAGFLLSGNTKPVASRVEGQSLHRAAVNKEGAQIIVHGEHGKKGDRLQMIDTELIENEPEQLIIRLFGDFKVMKGGRLLEGKQLQRSKVRALLIHLALNMGRGLARESLLERIWPDKDHAHAKDNFYSNWSMLNSLLSEKGKDSPYLSNRQGLCRLEQKYVTADVYEFELLTKAVLFQQGSIEDRIDAIYRIEQLYRGDIMSGTKIDSYVQAAQNRYRSILVDVMIEASKLFSHSGNETNAVWFARKAYDTDPTREDVYRTLMSMQDKAGQRTSALRTYFDCKRFLSEELGILPSQKTIALYQELVMDGR